MHKRDHIKSILALPRIEALWLSLYKRLPDENDVEELCGRFLPLLVEALKSHSRLIPGTTEAIKYFRDQKLKIGTSTGYTREMMDVVTACALEQGYQPDHIVCADEVPKGRPAPFMMFENVKRFLIYPMHCVVKIGDTPADIDEGINASAWTIGVARSGNEFGLSEEEDASLLESDRLERLEKAKQTLFSAGAHYVVEDILQAACVIDDINARLSREERP
jgi:phosphonoacetaldehyde hydrolase